MYGWMMSSYSIITTGEYSFYRQGFVRDYLVLKGRTEEEEEDDYK